MLTRPIGISVTAVLVLVASVAMLVIGIYGLTPSAPAKDLSTSLVAMALGGAGIATGVGILRLQRWARLSLLVFSVAIASWILHAAPVAFMYPLSVPADIPPEAIPAGGFRTVSAMILLSVFAFASWCVYVLNTSKSRTSFGLQNTGRTARPLGSGLIGGFLLVGGVLSFFVAIGGSGVAMSFGFVFTGWAAPVIWLIFSIAELYIGTSLLWLKPRAFVLTVYWFIYQFVEVVVFFVRPDRELRVADFYDAMHSYFQRRPGAPVSLSDVSASFQFWSIECGILSLIALWYLASRKMEFYPKKAGESHVAGFNSR